MKYNIEERKEEENGTGKNEKYEVNCDGSRNQNKDFYKKMFFENQENCIWLSTKDVSRIFSLTENAIRIMVYRKQIKPYKLGRRLRFKASELERLLSEKGESNVY